MPKPIEISVPVTAIIAEQRITLIDALTAKLMKEDLGYKQGLFTFCDFMPPVCVFDVILIHNHTLRLRLPAKHLIRESQLEVDETFGDLAAPNRVPTAGEAEEVEPAPQDDLAARLEALRG